MRLGTPAGAGAVGRPALALCGALLLAAVVPRGVPGARAQGWQAPPVVAEGEIPFYVDGAVLLSEAGIEETFVYLAVPGEEVRCVELPTAMGRWMQVTATLRFLDLDGSPLASVSSDLEVPCAPPDPNAAFTRPIISLRVPDRRGPGLVETVLADRNATRVGLIHQLRSTPRAGTARALLPRPVLRGTFGLGGPLFLWGTEKLGELSSTRGFRLGDADVMRNGLEPNPARGYGLFQPNVLLYAELYGCSEVETDLNLRVLAPADSTVLFEEQARVRPRWDRCGLVRQLDVTQLAAGAYVIELSVRPTGVAAGEPASGSVRLQARFQVAWDPDSWAQPISARMEEASLLMDPERWDRFVKLGTGQQEAALDSLWRSVRGGGSDPEELKALFRQRAATADARFSGTRRGILTDRGRVFVNFGDPDEIHKQLAPQDEDLIYYFLRREIDDTEAGEAGGRPHRHPMDTSRYQVWYYINWGRPLFPQVQSQLRGGGGGLRFIFLDEMGTGDYRLIYTNLFGGFD